MVNIVVDSGCNLTEGMKNKENIEVSLVPLNLQLGDKLYVDDEKLDVSAYIEDMHNYPDTPKTSAPSPERYLEKFKNAGSTFAVTLSSQLSGSYNSAMLAKEIYVDEIGNKFIHVFDSLSACVGETLIALKIDEAAKNNLSDMEIVETVNKFINNMRTYFILERYDNLVKTGRINPYVAKIASFLNIKAICHAKEGKMHLLDQGRGFKQAISKLLDRIIQDENLENKTLGITHVKCLDKALFVKEEVLKRIQFKEILIVDATGLCSTYADKDGIVLAY